MKTPDNSKLAAAKRQKIISNLENTVFDLQDQNKVAPNQLDGNVSINYHGEPKRINLSKVHPIIPIN